MAWWVVKPVATLAGLGAAIAHLVTGHGVLGGVITILVVVFVRPVTRPWFGLLAGIAVALLVPAAGVAVMARTVAGVAGVMLAGHGWRGGLEVVTRGRSALVEAQPLEAVWIEFGAAAQQGGIDDDLFDLFDHALLLFLAAWCTADARTLLSTTRELLAGLTTGRWRFPVAPAFEAQLMQLALGEQLVNIGCKVVAAAGAGVAVWLVGLAESTRLFGVGIPSWVTVLPAILVAVRGVRRDVKSIVGVGLAMTVVAAFVLYGLHAAAILGLGAAVAIPVRRLHTTLNQLLLTTRVRLPRLPMGPGWFTARDHWATACRAVRDGRPDIARKLWAELAADAQGHASIQVVAEAALADLALEEGALQDAVDWTTRALKHLPAKASTRAQVCATAGRVLLAAGDTKQASDLLGHAALHRRYRRDPQVVASRAQAVALTDAGKSMSTVELAHVFQSLARIGRLDQLINAQVTLAELPGDHTPFEVREKRLLDILSMDLDGPDIGEATVRARISSALARGWLTIGRLQLDNSKPSDAATSLRRAVSGLSAPTQTLEQAVARTLLGAALSTVNRGQAMTELAVGVREMEERRGQLTAGQHRNQLIGRHATVYRHVFEATMTIQQDDSSAPLLAAELAESLRRSALARTLRGRQLELTPELQAVLRRIAVLESQETCDESELQECRSELGDKLSQRFAAAYLPEPVDYGRLRSRVSGAHVLTYHLDEDSPQQVSGHVVWTPPQEVPLVARFEIADDELLALLGARGGDERNRAMMAQQKPDELTRWQRLAAHLLPKPLRLHLLKLEAEYPASIMLVPDRSLAALPWAALRLDDGRPLVTVAILQLTPTLELLDDDQPPHLESAMRPRQHSVLIHFDTDIRSAKEEERLTTLGGATTTSTQTDFLEGLSAIPVQGAYLAVHGNLEGLSQYVRFADGSRLSAATALAHRWPDWVIFASCLVGRVSVDLGQEPLGLPISCLLGGARTVLGGVITVHNGSSGPLASKVARRLLNGEHPARALRTEQLAVLAKRSTPARPSVWAGMICLSRAHPAA